MIVVPKRFLSRSYERTLVVTFAMCRGPHQPALFGRIRNLSREMDLQVEYLSDWVSAGEMNITCDPCTIVVDRGRIRDTLMGDHSDNYLRRWLSGCCATQKALFG